MAYLAVVSSSAVNGVAAIHSGERQTLWWDSGDVNNTR